VEKDNRGVIAGARKVYKVVGVACRMLQLDLGYSEADAAICRLASVDRDAPYDAVQLELRLLVWVLLFCGVIVDMEERRISQRRGQVVESIPKNLVRGMRCAIEAMGAASLRFCILEKPL
jgi:hypothetical protein